ncbi:MAG TPA: hypothetical protein VJJ47_02835 [Candidatus Paceibacterota bacterium]
MKKLPRARLSRTAKKILIVLAGAVDSLGQYEVRNRQVWRLVRRELGGLSEWSYRRTLGRLARAGMTVVCGSGPDAMVGISPRGRQIVAARALGATRVSAPKGRQWDGLWRIVSFDVPNIVGERRSLLRIGLEALGFWRMQRSIFVHPAKEVFGWVKDIVCALGIEKFVRTATAEIGRDGDLRKIFFKSD